MTRNLRKFVLTAHVFFTVSWLGTVLAFVILAIVGITGKDVQITQSAYISMDYIARFGIVPLSFAPLITGPLLSLGTPWGLFRHYWIIAKLIITILCTIIMQLHLQPINMLADAAINSSVLENDLQQLQIQMVIASCAAVVALLTATALGVYKPKGMTMYGWRKQYQERIETSTPNSSSNE